MKTKMKLYSYTKHEPIGQSMLQTLQNSSVCSAWDGKARSRTDASSIPRCVQVVFFFVVFYLVSILSTDGCFSGVRTAYCIRVISMCYVHIQSMCCCIHQQLGASEIAITGNYIPLFGPTRILHTVIACESASVEQTSSAESAI